MDTLLEFIWQELDARRKAAEVWLLSRMATTNLMLNEFREWGKGQDCDAWVARPSVIPSMLGSRFVSKRLGWQWGIERIFSGLLQRVNSECMPFTSVQPVVEVNRPETVACVNGEEIEHPHAFQEVPGSIFEGELERKKHTGAAGAQTGATDDRWKELQAHEASAARKGEHDAEVNAELERSVESGAMLSEEDEEARLAAQRIDEERIWAQVRAQEQQAEEEQRARFLEQHEKQMAERRQQEAYEEEEMKQEALAKAQQDLLKSEKAQMALAQEQLQEIARQRREHEEEKAQKLRRRKAAARIQKIRRQKEREQAREREHLASNQMSAFSRDIALRRMAALAWEARSRTCARQEAVWCAEHEQTQTRDRDEKDEREQLAPFNHEEGERTGVDSVARQRVQHLRVSFEKAAAQEARDVALERERIASNRLVSVARQRAAREAVIAADGRKSERSKDQAARWRREVEREAKREREKEESTRSSLIDAHHKERTGVDSVARQRVQHLRVSFEKAAAQEARDVALERERIASNRLVSVARQRAAREAVIAADGRKSERSKDQAARWRREVEREAKREREKEESTRSSLIDAHEKGRKARLDEASQRLLTEMWTYKAVALEQEDACRAVQEVERVAAQLRLEAYEQLEAQKWVNRKFAQVCDSVYIWSCCGPFRGTVSAFLSAADTITTDTDIGTGTRQRAAARRVGDGLGSAVCGSCARKGVETFVCEGAAPARGLGGTGEGSS